MITSSAVGSARITAFIAEKAYFGATNVPASATDLTGVRGGPAVQVPVGLGVVVIAYNLPGGSHLKLTGPVAAWIFLGQITRWDDPAITASPADHSTSVSCRNSRARVQDAGQRGKTCDGSRPIARDQAMTPSASHRDLAVRAWPRRRIRRPTLARAAIPGGAGRGRRLADHVLRADERGDIGTRHAVALGTASSLPDGR